MKTDKDKSVFGEWIRGVRLSKGFGLRQLSRMSNISSSHLAVVESGKKSLSLKSLKSLCSALGIEPSDAFKFIGGINPVPTVMDNLMRMKNEQV